MINAIRVNLTQSGRMLLWLSFVAAAFAVFVAVWWQFSDKSDIFWTNRDFANYWMASRLVLQGQVQDLFSGHDIYFSHMQGAFGRDYPWHSWSYPPHFLLLIWPLGFLPFGLSMVAFLLGTLFLYLHAASLLIRRRADFPVHLLLPFVICNVFTAQNGFLTAALFLYALALREKRPLVAGFAIGLLTVKPQLGILLPFFLLIEQRWRVIFAAAVTTVAAILLSGWIFGFDAWRGYVENTWPYQTGIMNGGGGLFLNMMPSVFGALRRLGYDASVAMNIHLPFAIIAFAVFIWTQVKMKSTEGRLASLAFATFLISPYSLVYDLGALVVLAAPLYRFGPENGLYRLIFVSVALVPMLDSLVLLTGLPLLPVILCGGWAALIVIDRHKPEYIVPDRTAIRPTDMDSARRRD